MKHNKYVHHKVIADDNHKGCTHVSIDAVRGSPQSAAEVEAALARQQQGSSAAEVVNLPYCCGDTARILIHTLLQLEDEELIMLMDRMRGMSQAKIGRKHGVTRQAIHARQRAMQTKYPIVAGVLSVWP